MSVICPFAGSSSEGRELLLRFSAIRREPGDEILIVDNTRVQVLNDHGARADELGLKIVRAPHQQSSYYARNIGVESSGADWLLFIDSDCIPSEDILDAYFADPIPDVCGAVAGGTPPALGQKSLAARYAEKRGILTQEQSLRHKYRPFGVTANLLVRRSAWESIGGFCEGIRSGGDADFGWRLGEHGWAIDFRPEAKVEHIHRERIIALLGQYAKYGAGSTWLKRRHPSSPKDKRRIAFACAAPILCLGLLLAGRRQDAAFRALDLGILGANRVGLLRENRTTYSGRSPAAATTAVLVDEFPDQVVLERVEALCQRQGGACPRIEARRRPASPQAQLARRFSVVYAEDDGKLRRLHDLAWLLVTRPVASLRDLLTERYGSSLLRLAPQVRRLAGSDAPLLVGGANDVVEDGRRIARLLRIGIQRLGVG